VRFVDHEVDFICIQEGIRYIEIDFIWHRYLQGSIQLGCHLVIGETGEGTQWTGASLAASSIQPV
jgi:hypothetical protein